MPSRKIAKSALILSEWSLIQRVLKYRFHIVAFSFRNEDELDQQAFGQANPDE